MGRNYDFKLDTSAMLVYCTPPNGYKSVAFAALDNISANTPDESMKKKLATLTSPFICLDGMNEKGVSIAVLTPAYYTAVSTAKLEQRSFCSAQNPTSFGVKLAYGVGPLEIRKRKKPETSRFIKKFQALFCLNWKFTAQSASSWGQVKEGSQMALFSFISLSMRLPFSCSRTSPYATLHNSPAIWCKSGVVVGVVDFRPKCPVYRSDLQRNGLWLPWWLPRKSPSWC